MSAQENEERLVYMTVPGRYVLYPKNCTKEQAEQAESVLLQPSSVPVSHSGDLSMTMYGVPLATVTDSNDCFDIKPYNFCFMLPELPNGMGAALYQEIEPKYIVHLNRAFDSLKEWFKRYADNIEPKFLDVRTEIEKYLVEFPIYPVASGFIEWFITHKIGGFQIVLTMPFDEKGNWINGGEGAIKYSFEDLWKIVDTRIDSDFIYEYIEFRQRQENAKKVGRERKKREAAQNQAILDLEEDLKKQFEQVDRMLNKRDESFLNNPKPMLREVERGKAHQQMVNQHIRENLIRFTYPDAKFGLSHQPVGPKVVEPVPLVEVPQKQTDNEFNGMPMEEVLRHFRQLATESSKNGKPFLSVEQVAQFIRRAFWDRSELPKLTINHQKEGQFIYSLFYQYYLLCTLNYQYEGTTQCRDKYIDLLSENFTNFTRKRIADNFHKPALRKWPSDK